MWMRNAWRTKAMGARAVAGSMVRDVGGMGVRIAATGDACVLGDDPRALAPCQGMAIDDGQCQVRSVAPFSDEQAVRVWDTVASDIEPPLPSTDAVASRDPLAPRLLRLGDYYSLLVRRPSATKERSL